MQWRTWAPSSARIRRRAAGDADARFRRHHGEFGDSLPVGISVDGPMGSDRRLLAIGRAFERVRGAFPMPRPTSQPGDDTTDDY